MTLPEPNPPSHYTEAEQQRLALNLRALDDQIHKGELLDRPARVELLCYLHERLFDGVRDHAGRIRRPGFGSPYLTFGPNRSVSNEEVPNQLIDTFGELQRAVASFDASPSAANYEESAIKLAAWVHAELIRIHPFEDGNGRSCRALQNWLLVRVGLRPIALEAVRQEYLACLNHYYAKGQIGPLVDLYLRLYPLPP